MTCNIIICSMYMYIHVIQMYVLLLLSLKVFIVSSFSGNVICVVDCTAKVWDLVTGQETAVLTRHHSYVRKVTFDHSSNLVFTACQSLIKLWDLRDLRNAQFVRTLL